LGGQGKKTNERISFLENFLHENPIVGDFDTDLLNERISKLKGGLIVIKAGGGSTVEMNECRDRIEDAVCAVKCALEEGFLTGGGSALLHASKSLQSSENVSFDFGVHLVKKACEAPFRRVIFNKTNSEPGIFLE